jgi:hypothetical protein
MNKARALAIGILGGGVSDAEAPAVTGFAATSPSASLDIAITTFTADADAAGFIITESSTPPEAGAAGWTETAPETYTVAEDDTYTLYPWVKDDAGNVSAEYDTPVSVVVDTTAPTVEITSTESSPTFAATIPLTITFSEDVTGFEVGDITVAGCTLSSFAGSGAVYTVTATPTANAITVDIAAGVCVDAAGNTNAEAAQFAIVSASLNLLAHPDFSNIATLFQDAAKTTPVTANNDPIGAVRRRR